MKINGVKGAGATIVDRHDPRYLADRLVLAIEVDSYPGQALMLSYSDRIAGSAYRVHEAEVMGMGDRSRLTAILHHKSMRPRI